jgi:transposase
MATLNERGSKALRRIMAEAARVAVRHEGAESHYLPAPSFVTGLFN